MPKYIKDRFGHRIRVHHWPSTAGMKRLRRHYKRKHPKAFREMIEKAVRTKKRKGIFKKAARKAARTRAKRRAKK